VGFQADHFRNYLFPIGPVDIFKVGGLPASPRPVIDNFHLNNLVF